RAMNKRLFGEAVIGQCARKGGSAGGDQLASLKAGLSERSDYLEQPVVASMSKPLPLLEVVLSEVPIIVVQAAKRLIRSRDPLRELDDPRRVELRHTRPVHARVHVDKQPYATLQPRLDLIRGLNKSRNACRAKVVCDFSNSPRIGPNQRIRDQHVAGAKPASSQQFERS